MSALTRFIGRTANQVLKPMKLSLMKTEPDFTARLTSQAHLNRMFDDIASTINDWLANQTVFEQRGKLHAREEVEQFFNLYLQSPFRDRFGGSRFGNLLWLNIIAKAAAPDVIIDSGTYKGGSAWALKAGAPGAKILSYDIDLSHLVARVDGVIYAEKDWLLDWSPPPTGQRVMAFFDDHVDQGKRLAEATERGIELLVFDDDLPVSCFAEMAHGGHALPKISFILDTRLADGEVIEWMSGGAQHRYTVRGDEMLKLRQMIAAECRTPNLDSIIGLYQLPFRLVRPMRAIGS